MSLVGSVSVHHESLCQMLPFCAKLLPMSENDTDRVHLEQLVDVMQSTIAQDLVVQGVWPQSVEEGNHLVGQRKYTITVLPWLNSVKQQSDTFWSIKLHAPKFEWKRNGGGAIKQQILSFQGPRCHGRTGIAHRVSCSAAL